MYGDDTKHFKLSIVPVFGVFCKRVETNQKSPPHKLQETEQTVTFFLPLDRPSLNQSLKAFRCNLVVMK